MSDNLDDNLAMDLASGMAAFEGKHFSTAIRLLTPLADVGEMIAQHRCAIMFQNGLGVTQNDEMAYKWMKAAAEQGEPIAQHGLGFMYLEGECTEKNGAEAAVWFEKAANQGLVGSQTTLAIMYEEGNGVEQDLDKARALYKLAGFDEKA